MTSSRSPIRRLLPIPRRKFLDTGLGGLAALMSARLVGCTSERLDPASTGGSGGAGTGGGGGAGGACATGGAGPGALTAGLTSNLASVGPLAATPDANGVLLPPGFTSRVVARTNEPPVPGGRYAWHPAPDGGATFAAADGGWVYVSNSEVPIAGGVGALRFDERGEIVDAYAILSDTNVNCAGGRTPWGTWLSCEEIDTGRVFECDPFGRMEALVHPPLGVFKHEAVAVDPENNHLYLTEDQSDGRLYRYVPDGLTCHGFADLASGRLEVAAVDSGGAVTWHEVPDPQFTGMTQTRHQVTESTAFEGGEGISYFDGVIHFSTKGDNRVWAYDIATSTMTVLYDAATAASPILTGVDNLTVTCCGDVLVAEDGGDMQIVAILGDGSLKPLLQIVGHDGSEITGPAFDPSGTRLYFSSQRAPGGGVTFEVNGPFHLSG
jgi:hypothetical protein